MIETIKRYKKTDHVYMMQLTGLDNIQRELSDIKGTHPKNPVFIECLACEGGCVNGPCTRGHKSGFEKRARVLNDVKISKNTGKRKNEIDNEMNDIEEVLQELDQAETVQWSVMFNECAVKLFKISAIALKSLEENEQKETIDDVLHTNLILKVKGKLKSEDSDDIFTVVDNILSMN